MDTSIIILISAATIFLLVSVINGLRKRKSKDIVSYYAMPNKFSAIMLIISMLGTIVGGGIVIGMTEMGAKGGVVGIILAIGYAIAFTLLYFIIPRIRALTNEAGVVSLIDLIDQKIKNPIRLFSYNIKISSLVSIIFFTSYFFILAAQFIAIVSFLDALAPTESVGSLMLLVVSILCSINIIFYCAFGGLEKDIRMDFFQVILMLITTIALLAIPFLQTGNPLPSLLTLPAEYFNGTGYGIAFFVVAILAPLPSFIARYDVWQRIIAAKSVNAAKKTFLFLSIGVIFFFAAFTFLGMYTQSVYHLSPSEMGNALFVFITSNGTYATSIALVCLLAAILSSADTFLNVSSISFSKLAFKKNREKISDNSSTPQEKTSLKKKVMISTIIIGLISIIVGYQFGSIVSLLIGAVSALTVLCPVIVHILLRKEINAIAAFRSIIIGYIVFLIVSFWMKMPDESFIPAFIISCIIFYPLNYTLNKRKKIW